MTLRSAALICMAALAAAPSPGLEAQPWREQLVLPSPTALPCCWRHEQALRIAVPGKALAGTATVTRDGEGLAVVVRDGGGARIASLRQGIDGQVRSGDGEDWSPGLDQLVLLAIHLHRRGPEAWLVSQPGWTAQTRGGRGELFHGGVLQARIDYRDPPEPGRARGFSFAAKGHALDTEVTARALLPQR